MLNSLEVRVPMLDHVVAEFAARIPIEQRMPRWRLKGLLKDTMADALPRELLRQPKRGFAVPLARWFRGDLAAYARDVLHGDTLRRRGVLDPAGVEHLLARHGDQRASAGTALWSVLMFELWCQQYLP
jgi:asparagine synthase (glutamine-hydrolysing)